MTKRNIIPAESIAALRDLVADARKIILTCHVSPDGDALGSTLAACRVLTNMGKHAVVVTPDRPPRTLLFLPGIHDVVSASFKPTVAATLMSTADLILCMDFNAMKRVDKMMPMLEKATARKVMIDHHLDPEPFCDITISRHRMSSTCELLYHVIDEAGWLDHLDTDAASCLYTGMMTDTGNFTYNSSDPDIYLIIAELVRRGIDKDRLYSLACNTFTESCLRLNGYALSEKMRIFPDHKAALITLSEEELRRFNYVKGDTEGLVNRPLSIPGVVYSAFLREDEPGFVKVSMRSKGRYPVNLICETYFNGGGHRNAAGGEMHLSLDETEKIFLASLPDNDKYLTETSKK